jgi:ABC-2 type transport system ATP-binding protein
MIKADNLTKRYGPQLAVDGLSFEVRPGRVTGFLGPNGAGKSTTMRLILGLDAPTSGSVTVNGRAYGQLRAPLHSIGALLDPKAVDPRRSAANHLLWLADSNGIDRKRVDEVLGLVGLADVAGRHVGTFSLGMNQRLGVAAALLGDPETVLLDEPINGLDPEGILWMRGLVRGLAAEGRTVFLSSHLMSEMAQTADQLIVIGRGRLIADAGMADIVQQHAEPRVRVRAASREPELAWLLTERGARIIPDDESGFTVAGLESVAVGEVAALHAIPLGELTPQQPSLEQAFIELTQHETDYRARLVGA